MAGTGPGDLWVAADELLDVCTEALDTIPTADGPSWLADLAGAPEYRYVSDAAPLPNCCDDGLLVVHVNNITDRFSREAAPQAPKLNVPSHIVTLLRCVPMGVLNGEDWIPPTVEQQTASSQQTLADAWALWNHIYNLIRAELFLTWCNRADFVSMQSIRPADTACAGWQLAFLMQVDGYESELGT